MSFPTFHIQTYGCQMNVSDSDWLVRALKKRGFQEASFDDAYLYIINTCSVRDKPERKVYSELGHIARHSKVHKKEGVTICVGGCVAQQVGASLAKRFPQVRLIFGTDGISHAPDAIERLAEDKNLRINLLDFADRYEEREDPWLAESTCDNADSAACDKKYAPIPPSVSINIMQGCNNFCAYCIVPYVRGRQKSRNQESILQECQQLLSKGAREITLLGQNVNSYGLDTKESQKEEENTDSSPFSLLLNSITKLDGIERLRFVTPHPKDISLNVIEAFGHSNVLCPRLHLPLQSGSDAVLQRMGRKYTVEKYLDIVKHLKSIRPDITFSTDIIVGFPGETEEDFCNTLSVMKEVGFVASYSFIYSDRPGAKATLFKDKIERNVALERLSRLQQWQNQFTEELLSKLVGLKTTILIEHKSQRKTTSENGEKPLGDESNITWQGRTDQGFIVNVSLPTVSEDQWIGRMLPVVIQKAGRHSLTGVQAGEPW